MTDLKRLILRKMEPEAATQKALSREVSARTEATVLDHSEEMMLIEGDAPALDQLAESIAEKGWRAFPTRTIDKPDARPRVLRPPKE